MNRHLVAAALLPVLATFWSRPAHAQAAFYTGSSQVYVVTPDRSMLSVDGQYFSATPSGVMDLCQSKPALCADPLAQSELGHLRRRYVAGNTLAIVGLVSSLTGIGLLIGGALQRPSSTPLLISGGASIGAGALFSITGMIVAPGADSVRRLVNTINGHSEGERIQWNLGIGPGGTTHLAATVRF